MNYTDEEITQLSIDKYGDDIHMWAKQRDGFIEGFKTAMRRANSLNICGSLPEIFNFKSVRKQNQLTLKQVEEKTGISNAYLSQLETGKIKKPSFDTIKKLYNLYYTLK